MAYHAAITAKTARRLGDAWQFDKPHGRIWLGINRNKAQ
jgi:hypothetical protein